MERDTLASRCLRAARAAIAPAVCDVAVRTRSPLAVDIQGVPGQTPLTPAQRATAKAAAEAVDARILRGKRPAALAAEIEAWVGTDPARLRKAAALALAVILAEYPRLARVLGVPVDGDEPT